MTTTLKVHFDGHVLVPEQPVDWPIGQSMKISVAELPSPPAQIGTAAALLAAIRSTPPVSQEDVAELERLIAEGRQQIRYEGAFDDEGR